MNTNLKTKLKMTDHLSKIKRRRNMQRIKSTNTFPELKIKELLRKKKLFYNQNVKKLPGSPDIVMSKDKKIIFVNGCFWHQHKNCSRSTVPKTNRNYWVNKFKKTIKRDKENKNKLKGIGWKVLVLWECEINKKKFAEKKINKFLKAV